MTSTARIISICSGNICRSPIAAVLLERKLEERKAPSVIISAGTLGLTGHQAAVHARAAVQALGLSLEGHRSQGISLPLLRMADHLLIMSTRHETAILSLDPALEERLVRLWHYDDETREGSGIPDPVGQDLLAFIACRDLLDRCLDAWIEERFEAPAQTTSSSEHMTED